MKCYYEILEIDRDADDNEIKTAYRKMALKWHPDKNIDNTEVAKEQFQFVQQAYEVLSDKQERAWYDNHREQILRGSDSNFKDDSLDVFPYFTTQCFKGYGDDEKGFYTVYRNVFEQIAKEDIEYMDSKSDYDDMPIFGNSTSDYEEVVGPFYAYWMSYNTKKSFVWLDPYNINETRERRVLKLIEKENKKVRQKAKKERNEEIRNLVAFVRKRDKRVQAYAKVLEAKNAENREKQEQLRKQKLIERKKEINTKTQAEWSKFDNVQHELKEIEKKLAEQFGEDLTDSESESVEQECDDLYCVACNKIFKNPKAFANHESSKKHKENAEKLKILMQEEEQSGDESLADEEIEIDENEEMVEDKQIENNDVDEIKDCHIDSEISLPSETEEISLSSKKKNKKNKKVIRIQNNYDSEEHELQNETEVTFDSEKNTNDNFDFGSSKKQKKKNSKNKATQEKTQSQKETNNDTTKSQDKTNEEATDTHNTDTSKPANNEKHTKTKNTNKIKINKIKGPVDVGDLDVSHCCVTCKSNFNSKNKLFDHLKKTGHGVLLAKPTQKVSKSKKKQVK